MTPHAVTRAQIKVEGTVQGVGYRPFVYRIASDMKLAGWIMNRTAGVEVEVEGPAESIDRFVERLRTTGPPSSRIDYLNVYGIPPRGDVAFTIRPSNEEGPGTIPIAPDMATCAVCVDELFDSHGRRFRYPWISCASCGPRFSMVTGVPYDRAQTTMARFTLCEACRSEYDNPADRRFHTESTACPLCGPRLILLGRDGARLAEGETAIRQTRDVIRTGGIAAVKGIGGFHLWADATSEEAVRRLRERKRRPQKPFAVMFPSLDGIRAICELSEAEAAWITSPQAPILILRQRDHSRLAPSVAPGQSTVGAMLPYAPLHHLLLHESSAPVVATSGNRSEEPLVTDESEAVRLLGTIADVLLIHDCPIARPVDDSVLRLSRSGPIILRRARGFAPESLRVSEEIVGGCRQSVLALGGHLKNTVALLSDERVLMSQHLGDLSTLETERAVRQAIDDLPWLLRIKPEALACDLHPDYRSTGLAEELAHRWHIPLLRVQHHHAHVASCMAEHGIAEQALGVAWDGSGYGTDGTLWGGEFLLATYRDCRRIAHLRPFPLPGGEQAMRVPRRVALAVLRETFGSEKVRTNWLHQYSSSQEDAVVLAMLDSKLRLPVTTSVGRLFDAVASMLGLCHSASFEGQAAMALEQAASHTLDGSGECYPIPLNVRETDTPRWQADWRPMIEAIAMDLRHGVSVSRVAYRFHRTLAELIGRAAETVGLRHVVLTGGCFQNALLLDLAVERLSSGGFIPVVHRRVPPNDGGLSLGQAVVAANRLQANQSGSLSII